MNAVQAIRYLEIENHELRRENGRLAKRIADERHHVRRVEQAYRDALLLALWAGAGIHPGRRYASMQGMSERQWENATALLRLARVLTGNRRWVTRDTATIEARLQKAARTAIEAEQAYLARHMRYRRR